MGTKTIGIREAVYERLRARKREGESFTDTIDRLIEESGGDWREGFGTLPAEETEALREATRESRGDTATALSARQRRGVGQFETASRADDGDERTVENGPDADGEEEA
ncbi:putative CopG family antitoxin [Halorubrum alkaliphilum]|uniref:Putative CopG family antitoxin n=1 Tax=Halorubrum alkaliphilum TaxID=261290 RepID=A0A8T4GHX7_9EURY|nr:antitoxin VapB family protein [Halorubrum alkaliphilum]MBP1922635.1 putative CopG family antitoxin [Halorubrum alkaliphilum]